MKGLLGGPYDRPRILGSLLFLTALLSAGLIWGEEKKAGAEGPFSAPAKAPSAEVRQPAKAPFDFRRLIGQWKRTDGNYVIEIRSIDANGRMEAVYTNPRPINISLAEAFREADSAKVYIVLWDQGYPGTTYELTYLPKKDALSGACYLLPTGKRLPVVFTRTR